MSKKGISIKKIKIYGIVDEDCTLLQYSGGQLALYTEKETAERTKKNLDTKLSFYVIEIKDLDWNGLQARLSLSLEKLKQ